MASTESTRSFTVKFKTEQDQYSVTTAPFQVPGNLNRRGLSHIINHLLAKEGEDVIPFDFLINEEYLRQSLAQFVTEKQIEDEDNGIEIWYTEALGAVTRETGFEHPDWVSSIQVKGPGLSWTGCYDGRIRLWEGEEVVAEFGNGKRPIKAIEYVEAGDRSLILEGSQDQHIRQWNVTDPSNPICEASFKGHRNSVDAIGVSPTQELIASGSWDSIILVWTLFDPKTHSSRQSDGEPDAKRRKTTAQIKLPRIVIKEHKQNISDLVWTGPAELVSSSWDRTMRWWDIPSGINTLTKNANKAILTMDFNKQSGLIATGHGDFSIKIWDPRQPNDESLKSLTSHKGWISDVCWHPQKDNLLLSGSHDMTLKLWDIRAKVPLHTLKNAHEEKILAVGWSDAQRFLSGGADAKLKIHETQGVSDTVQ